MSYDGQDPYEVNNDDICSANDPSSGRGSITRNEMDVRINNVVSDECYNNGPTTNPGTYDARAQSHRETVLQVFSDWTQGFREMMEEAMHWEAQKSLSGDMHALTTLLNVETDKVERVFGQIFQFL